MQNRWEGHYWAESGRVEVTGTSAANGERHEALGRSAGNDVVHDATTVAGSSDVQEDQFVGTLGVVGLGRLDGITGVAQFLEFHSLDDTTVGHIEAGDDSAGEHR